MLDSPGVCGAIFLSGSPSGQECFLLNQLPECFTLDMEAELSGWPSLRHCQRVFKQQQLFWLVIWGSESFFDSVFSFFLESLSLAQALLLIRFLIQCAFPLLHSRPGDSLLHLKLLEDYRSLHLFCSQWFRVFQGAACENFVFPQLASARRAMF